MYLYNYIIWTRLPARGFKGFKGTRLRRRLCRMVVEKGYGIALPLRAMSFIMPLRGIADFAADRRHLYWRRKAPYLASAAVLYN